MDTFSKTYELKWNDLDANAHMANSKYSVFMADTRMQFFLHYGFGVTELLKANLAPVVLDEHFFYLKEILYGETISVKMELKGITQDNMIALFAHKLYNSKGKLSCYAEVKVGMLDRKTRKLCVPPEDMTKVFSTMTRTKDFSIIEKQLPKIPLE